MESASGANGATDVDAAIERTAELPAGLCEALHGARNVVVLSGAGMSAESGVPTFREAQTGLWARFDPQALATPEAFARDPALVWRWYEWRRDLVADAEPHAGHRALAELEARVERCTVITQNVDGLHRRAGSREVIEFHGNLFENRCFVEGHVLETLDTSRGEPPPRCPDCGAWARPGVVWFGEAIPAAALEAADAALSDVDLFLSVGTSSSVYPAAGLIEQAARRGATLVEINTEDSALAGLMDFRFTAPAGAALPALVDALGNGGPHP